MSKMFLLILSLFAFSNFVTITLQEVVKVSLYYEALCPYSEQFIAEQLYPGFQSLGSALDIELVPYGKAKQKKVHEKWQTTCPHGPKECYANKLQACALTKDFTQEQSMVFIGCLMSTHNPEKNSNARKCAGKAKLTWKTIKSCAKGEEGNQLFAHFGNVTSKLQPPLEYVPHILFNDKNNMTTEMAAREDFLKVVCEIFTEKPAGC